MNNTAITVQTSSAVVVQRVMARLMSLAHRERIARSARTVVTSFGDAALSLSSNTRARSIIRPSLLVMTARIAPIPERRKTGDRQLDCVSYGDVGKLKHSSLPNGISHSYHPPTRLSDNLSRDMTEFIAGKYHHKS
jgi:hypothetical protein